MILRSLNFLGGFKWPSLLLVSVVPVVAYLYWLPPTPLRRPAGTLTVDGTTLCLHRLNSGGQMSLHVFAAGKPAPVKTLEVAAPGKEWIAFAFDGSGARADLPDANLAALLWKATGAKGQALPVRYGAKRCQP